MKSFLGVVLSAVVALSGVLRAHDDGAEQPSSECAHWLSTTPGFQVCVTADGTIDVLKTDDTLFIGPYGGVGGWEGHALCHAGGEYQDIRLATGVVDDGWREPTLVSKSGSKVVVRRTTTDDRFTLTQTWTRNVAQRAVTVANALKANMASNGVYFARVARPLVFPLRPATADLSRNGYSIRTRIVSDDIYLPWTAVTATDAKFSNPYAWIGGLDVAGYCRAAHETLSGSFPPGFFFGGEVAAIRYFAGNMAAGQTKTYTVVYRVQ